MNTITNTDRILIVGGTGFIGKHLIKRCLKETSFVTCLSLTGFNNKNFVKGVEYLEADITNKKQLQSVLHNKIFDYVFNLGGNIDHTHYFKNGRKIIETHFVGLLNILDCIDIKNLKGFVQVGSSDEYGSAPSPQNEAMREKPISPYSHAKVAASHFIQMLYRTEGFPGVILRFFLVYGFGQDDRRLLPYIIKGCLNNIEFKTSEGKQLRDFCYIDDIVDAMVKAAVSSLSKGQILNIASGVPVTIREVIQKVMAFAGGGKPLWGAHPYRVGENMELYADVSLAKKLLNWEPQISIDEGLKKTIECYRGMVE